MDHPVFDLFHPLISKWFAEKVGLPTDVQVQAWPRVAKGAHVLITAPTGSGKTLAAFLWALQKLITGDWLGGRVRVLYVSPLKALNNDVQRRHGRFFRIPGANTISLRLAGRRICRALF